jgi:hypothetical protein
MPPCRNVGKKIESSITRTGLWEEEREMESKKEESKEED